MPVPTTENLSIGFEDGRSANVDIYQSDRGRLAVVTNDVTNPFNHGEELIEHREEIANVLSKEFGCEPQDFRYIEQAGQHFQSVPLERSSDGRVKLQDQARVIFVPEAELRAEIDRNQAPDLGQDLAQSPEWSENLSHPKGQTPDR